MKQSSQGVFEIKNNTAIFVAGKYILTRSSQNKCLVLAEKRISKQVGFGKKVSDTDEVEGFMGYYPNFAWMQRLYTQYIQQLRSGYYDKRVKENLRRGEAGTTAVENFTRGKLVAENFVSAWETILKNNFSEGVDKAMEDAVLSVASSAAKERRNRENSN